MKNLLSIILLMFASYSIGQHLDVEGHSKIRGNLDVAYVEDTTSVHIGPGAGISADYFSHQFNTFVGNSAGMNNTTGLLNSFYGYESGKGNAGGLLNSFFGSESGLRNNGIYNVFIGAQAGYENIEGQHNTFVGSRAGFLSTNSSNSFFGYEAGFGNIGTANCFIGASAGSKNATGSWNTNVGNHAGGSGSRNVCLGFSAGTFSTGNKNTFIGANSGNSHWKGDNIVTIGWDAQPSTDSAFNEITLGNDSIEFLRCNVKHITSLSDRRDKSQITDLTAGLDFLMTLKPRQFHWDRREWYRDADPDETKMNSSPSAGFIAQELDEAQDSYGVEWLGLVLKI